MLKLINASIVTMDISKISGVTTLVSNVGSILQLMARAAMKLMTVYAQPAISTWHRQQMIVYNAIMDTTKMKQPICWHAHNVPMAQQQTLKALWTSQIAFAILDILAR